ncbi:hypothetical protein D3C87_1282750 [compost metagenome]
MRRPIGDAHAIDQQVVIDPGIRGQGNIQLHINQVHKRVAAHRNDRALPFIKANVGEILQAQRQLQRPGPHQPHHQPRWLQAPQQRAGQDRWQGRVIVGQWQRCGHPGSRLLGRRGGG